MYAEGKEKGLVRVRLLLFYSLCLCYSGGNVQMGNGKFLLCSLGYKFVIVEMVGMKFLSA